jgi:hypothetical protein
MAALFWACVTPERRFKTLRLMKCTGARHSGRPGDARRAPGLARALRDLGAGMACAARPAGCARGLPAVWHLDNGFHRPARGSPHGYYRITHRGMSPVLLLRNPEPRPALRVAMRRWRKDGRHVVLALPGETLGRAIGLDVPGWIATIGARLRAATDRPIRVRPKYSRVPLAGDLRDAWALVTHSSNVAVDAVICGIPVFVAPTSPAAPAGRTDLDIEHPAMPDRDAWWASLTCQQFTLSEMADGTAWRLMRQIAAQVDRRSSWRSKSVAPPT